MNLARGLMTMRADTQRNTADSDSWGSPGAPGWETILHNEACFFWIKGHRQIADGSKLLQVEDVKAIFPGTADISIGDRVVRVLDRNGGEIMAGPLFVEAVSSKSQGTAVAMKEVTMRRADP